jgi:hypothetical protein
MSLVDFISLRFVGAMAVMITAIVTSSLGIVSLVTQRPSMIF